MDFPSPFDILEPKGPLGPLVFNSPHSGAVYPEHFLRQSKLDALNLRRSEDCHVDALFADAPLWGAPLMRAHFPRAFLDVNREAYELDPRMFEGRLPAFANTRSLRVAGGLGTIPRLVGDAHEIYARRIPAGEALERIERLYKPYHRALQGLIDRARDAFGLAVLIDCHSMPSGAGGRDDEKTPRADFVLGDRYGTSAAARIVDCIEAALRGAGYLVHRNKPYAGGFITEHHGNPRSGSHAVQIEICRALYMDERTLARAAGFDKVRRDLAGMIAALAALVRAETGERRLAAE